MSDEARDPRIAAWLHDEAPAVAPDSLHARIDTSLGRTRQRRTAFASPALRFGTIAAAAAVVVLALLANGAGRPEPPSGEATASATAPGPSVSEAQRATHRPSPSPTAPQPTFEGDTWEQVEIPNVPNGGYGGARPQEVVVGGPGLVAVGSVSPCCADVGYDDEPWGVAIWTSPDGRRWELVGDLETFGKAGLTGLAANDSGLMVAVGYEVLPPLPDSPTGPLVRYEGRAWRSSNGIDWVAIPAPGGTLTDVAWGPNGWVAVGSLDGRQAVFTSRDLATWETVTIQAPGELNHVAVDNNGATAAIGCVDEEVCRYQVVSSADGSEWTATTLDGVSVALVADPHGGFVAVGAASEGGAGAWWSEDGVTWDGAIYEGSRIEGFSAVGVDHDGIIAAEASAYEGEAVRIWHSLDRGMSWTMIAELEHEPAQLDRLVTTLAFSDAQYIALGTTFEETGQPAAWHGP